MAKTLAPSHCFAIPSPNPDCICILTRVRNNPKSEVGTARVRTQTWVCTCVLQAVVQNVVRSTLSLTFVIALARVVFNVKGRMTREATWELELKGDLTKQRRVEAVDKLLSVLTLLVASVFGLQAVGLDGAPALPVGQLLAAEHYMTSVTVLTACNDETALRSVRTAFRGSAAL